MNKYKLTKETKLYDGTTLYRIQALKSFGNVKAGDLGGWIENNHNLQQNGNCWVYDDSMVYGGCSVIEKATVSGNSVLKGYSWIFKNAVVNNSKVLGDCKIFYTLKNQSVECVRYHDYNINYSGFDEKSGEHFVRVGCQNHSITTWRDPAKRLAIMRKTCFDRSLESMFLKVLDSIETRHCTPQDPFVKIEANISEMKKTVTETLKTETISLISSLQVSVAVVSKSGPQRDKFGRFARKS